MNTTGKVAAAVASGYLLGRTKKLRLAITVGGLLAGKRLNTSPRALVAQASELIEKNPELARLSDQVRGKLMSAGREAAIAAASNRMNRVSDSIRTRTDRFLEPPLDDEDEYDEDEYDEDDTGDDSRSESRNGSRSGSRRGSRGQSRSQSSNGSRSQSGGDSEDDGEEEAPRRRRRPAAKATSNGRTATKRAGSTGRTAKKTAAKKSTTAKRAPSRPAKKAAAKKTTAKKTAAKKSASGSRARKRG